MLAIPHFGPKEFISLTLKWQMQSLFSTLVTPPALPHYVGIKGMRDTTKLSTCMGAPWPTGGLKWFCPVREREGGDGFFVRSSVIPIWSARVTFYTGSCGCLLDNIDCLFIFIEFYFRKWFCFENNTRDPWSCQLLMCIVQKKNVLCSFSQTKDKLGHHNTSI